MAETTVYLQLEPQWGRWTNRDGDRVLAGMKVAGMTQRRPDRAKGPVVRLTLRVPDAAFLPLRPTVVIDVPDEALDFEPVVTVEVETDG